MSRLTAISGQRNGRPGIASRPGGPTSPAPLVLLQVVIASCLVLTGCSTLTTTDAPPASDLAKIQGSWKPYLLYLLSSPHPRLYVEVEAVEGCVPSEARLGKMREFLAQWCEKPGGIEIVRSGVISRQAARGLSARTLARKYMKGPPVPSAAAAPAFLYVLFYDDALSYETPSAAPSEAEAPPRHRRPPITHPCADFVPYPAIFFNTRYGPETIQTDGLVHEAGHILGLAGRADYASGYHCSDQACLMTATLRANRRIITPQRKICARCQMELVESLRQSPSPNLRFVGPVLVRAEDGYYVLTLPERVKLVAGELTEQDCRDFVAAVRAEPPPRSDHEIPTAWLIKNFRNRDPADLQDLMQHARNDPFPSVRAIWPQALAQSCAQRYATRGQFANAVGVLRQALAWNAADDWTGSQLAWLLATCPDPSVRDGKTAVSMAQRTCEITRWKNGGRIDTLAAACAETGDFKSATKYEEQALSTGPLTDQQRTLMRARLALYRQSQPFRDYPSSPPQP